ncbi:MAG: hypothetical protein ACK4R6_03400 [Spirosomataceae bacterium]
MSRFNYLLFFFFLGLSGCSQFSNSPTSKVWHGLNAKYNAYLLAKQNMDFAQQVLEDTLIEDYSKLLPIFFPADSITTSAVKNHYDVAIKMTSLVAERHSNTRFLYPSYLLLADARLQKGLYSEAIDVYKYVNGLTNDVNIQQKALTGLFRAYIEANDLNTARQVSEILKKSSLSKENIPAFLLTEAYFQQKLGQIAVSAALLDEVLPSLPKSFRKGRLLYISGQMYELLGRTDLAYARFDEIAKMPVPYAMRFQANINAMIYSKSRDKSIQKNIEKLVADRRNETVKDQVYYKLGELAENEEDWSKALAYYKKSVASSVSDINQKGNSYLAIADLLFDEWQDYPQAKKYYDSALVVVSPQNPSYSTLVSKAKSLEDAVRFITIIEKEDSLQRLATYPVERVDEIVRQLVETELKEKEARKTTSSAGNLPKNGVRFALVDPIQMAKDKVAFLGIWGSRLLEDNWRRKDKDMGGISFQLKKDTVASPTFARNLPLPSEQRSEKETEIMALYVGRRQELEKSLPKTPEQLAASKQKQEEAYYQLGKIYRFQFNELALAKQTFEEHLVLFPESAHEAEVLYFLSLLTNEKQKYQQLLTSKYPESIFARQAAMDSKGTGVGSEEEAIQAYQQMYVLFEKGENERALQQMELDYYKYVGTQMQDKLAYLRILLLAKSGNLTTYKQAIQDFIAYYSTSPLLEDVQTRQKIMTQTP